MAGKLIIAPEAEQDISEAFDSVFYECANGTVTVYCVFHNSRDPQKWQERLS